MLPHTVISTVGTSLLTNLQRLEDKSPSECRNLFRSFQEKDYGQIARNLRLLFAADRLCGAEINSLHDLFVRQIVQNPPICLHFCVSETEEGATIGKILKFYYEAQNLQVQTHSIEGLQDVKPGIFRTLGLRNLVRKVGEIVRRTGADYTVINATGGYKAQIAVAAIIGQTLSVQVFYKHERFSEIIGFPPLPISFDYDLLGQNAALLDALESGELFEVNEAEIDPTLRVLLEEVDSKNSEKLWALAPIGQIYIEGFRLRYPLEKTLPPTATERKEVAFRDDHYPNNFREFVSKVWNENSFFTSCHSLPYDKQNSIRNREFYVRHDGQIIGEYVDNDKFGARFAINTTATTLAQKTVVVMFLNQKYGKN